MNIINLTPHALIIHSGAFVIEIAPSGAVARCKAASEPAGRAGPVNLYRTTYGAVEGLPDPVDDTLYVVSGLVRAAVPARTDVASPGELVRNDAGAVVGCRGLVVN